MAVFDCSVNKRFYSVEKSFYSFVERFFLVIRILFSLQNTCIKHLWMLMTLSSPLHYVNKFVNNDLLCFVQSVFIMLKNCFVHRNENISVVGVLLN